jgi:hypothetical protein
MWIIDFGAMIASKRCAIALFEHRIAYMCTDVKPERGLRRMNQSRLQRLWWLHASRRPAFRRASSTTAALCRYCRALRSTGSSSGCPVQTCYRRQVVCIARADDTTFGLLHSRLHELWSLRLGTSLEDRPRYTPTTCFETFPFPAGLTPADTAHQRTEPSTTAR